MTSRLVLLLAAWAALLGPTYQATTTHCKNCVVRTKDERAMFEAHSAACMTQSGASRGEVDALLTGAVLESPALKRHVYCVLRKCKLIGKDGKLQKAAVLGKLAGRANAKNATKVLESCFAQGGDTPEELAWSLFRCGYEKKAILFDMMPTGLPSSGGGALDDNMPTTRR